MQQLAWLWHMCSDDEECDLPAAKQFLRHPFRVGDWAVATNGHALIAVKVDGECGYDPDEVGAKAVKKFLGLPSGTDSFPMKPLQDWAAYRYSDVREECAIIHGSPVDRRVVWHALKNIKAKTYRLNQLDKYGIKKSMLIFDGDGWRVVLMGLRNTKQTGELPEYTPAEQPQETVAVG